MSSNALSAKEQHGFLSRKSCVTQLLTATEYWSEVLQQGDSVDVVYFDFRKAFDPFLIRGCFWNLNHMELRVNYWIGSLPFLQTENTELLLMNHILAGLMSLVAYPRDQCWDQFYSLYTLMTYLTLYLIKFWCLLMTPNCFIE